jgi:hypothetical protein
MVYSIIETQPTGSADSPTISAEHFSIGDLKVLKGTFRATASNGFNALPPYGAILEISFNNPVFTETPQIFCQVNTPGGLLPNSLLSACVGAKTTSSFYIIVNCTANDFPAGDIYAIDFLVVGK